ncbi:hypothetical protein AB6H17_13760 [Proteus vulgaris]|uniref:hypothetical protein n=1 Tax=Proteus vulgaris TaxID=585 RepID=UPI0034DD06A1
MKYQKKIFYWILIKLLQYFLLIIIIERIIMVFFLKYIIYFPKSYQKRLDINNKAHGNIMLMHENLNVILNSDNFKDGKLPEWANKLITKTLKESKPKNDILWLFSKERKEWNKIFNMLIVK